MSDGGLSLDLLTAGGTLLATGVEAQNAAQVINNYSSSGGSYVARVTGGGEYSLVVTRGSDFDTESNDDPAIAQQLTGVNQALGHAHNEFSTLGPVTPSGSVGFSGLDLPWEDVEPQASIVLPSNSDLGFFEAMGLLKEPELDDDSNPIVAGLQPNVLNGPIPIGTQFPGIGYTRSIPPDPIVAVGPAHVVAMVNTQIAIYDKAGNNLFQQNLNGGGGFFGSAGATTTVFDPWVLFDTDSQRFFAMGIDLASATQSNVFLAVSTDATPTSGADWHKYKINFSHNPPPSLGSGTHFPDYPKMGVNEDVLTISGNYFPISGGSGVYAGITMLDKAPLLSGGPANKVYEEHFSGFSVMPMTQYDSGSTQYFAQTATGSGNSVLIHAITDPLVAPTRTTFDLPVPSYAFPPDVPQLGGGTPADSVDARTMTGVWRGGSMYVAHAIEDPADADSESEVRWYEVATNNFPLGGNPSLQQVGNVDPGPGVWTWMPHIAVDGRDNVGIGFSIGGPNQYFSAGFTGRLSSDPPGTTALPVTTYATGQGPYSRTDGLGRNRWGDYSGLAIDAADDATFWAYNEYATSTNTWATEVASFQLESPADEDWYAIEVNANDTLSIITTTPLDAPENLANELDPAIELYDPNGNLVAADDDSAGDGKNATLTHTALLTGQYVVRVNGPATEGEYTLQISGATGADPAPEVIASTPADGGTLNAFPAKVRLDFSESLLLTSVGAADAVIGGLPATSVTVIDGDTLEFTINPAADIGEGTYAVTVATGNVDDLQGQGNLLYNGTFTVDTTGPRIVATEWNGGSFPASATFAPGDLAVTARFDEPLSQTGSARRGPITPGADDVILFESFTSTFYSPASISYDDVTYEFTANFEDLPEGNYLLRLASGDNAFEDLVGNDLDGEPLGPGLDGTPTGNGVPGGDYLVSFVLDIDAVEANEFERLNPLGSLMNISRENTSLLNFPGDVDAFTFFHEVGQPIAAVAYPVSNTATLSIELVGHAGPFTAAGPGEPVFLPAEFIAGDGIQTIEISGDEATFIEVDIYRNLVLESEVGDSFDGNEVPLAPSFTPLGSGAFAALGLADAELLRTEGLVYGVRPATGEIIKIDPSNGNVVDTFPAPDALAPGHTQIGLSIAEDGNSLLYVNSDVDPTRLYRLDPVLGTVLSVESLAGTTVDGLGFAAQIVTYFSQDFESGLGPNETVGGSFTINNSNVGLNNGTNMMGHPSTYGNDEYSYYEVALDLTGAVVVPVILSFEYTAHIESHFDRVNVQASTGTISPPGDLITPDSGLPYEDHGDTYHPLLGQIAYDSRGNHRGTAVFDLTGYAGSVVNVRVQFGSDEFITLPGFNLDNLLVTSPGDSLVFLSNDGVSLRRQADFSGPETAGWATGAPTGALGGDGHGRQFGYFTDGLIHEYAPNVDTNSFINGFAPPAPDIEGLAYDGVALFASTASGTLYTLDPDDGSVLNAVPVASGALFGLGALPRSAAGGDDTPIDELEPNDSIAAAQSLEDYAWSLAFNPNIGDASGNTSEIIPHVTVLGTGNNTFDHYSFEVTTPNSLGIFDIDFGFEGGLVNAYLRLYRDDGTFLTSNDDSPTSWGAGGSSGDFDSYIQYTFSNPGTYVIQVGRCCVSPVPGGGDYELQVSLQNHETVAAPIKVFAPDIDEYELDLTGKAGELIDIIVQSQGGGDLSNEVLQILDTDGITVLDTGVPNPLGPDARNYDLGILDFRVPADGVYTVRLKSYENAEYGLLVTDRLTFDTERNNDPTLDPLRSLDGTLGALGYLEPSQPLLFAADWTDPPPTRILTLDPSDAAIQATYGSPPHTTTNPFGLNMAFDGQHLWYNAGANFGDNTVYQVDGETGALVGSFVAVASGDGFGLAYLRGELYLADADGIDVYSLDGTYQRTLPEPAGVSVLQGLAGDDAEGYLYAVAQNTDNLYRLDPQTGQVLAAALAPPVGFQEGLGLVGDELYVSETTGLNGLNEIAVYDKNTFAPLRRMPVAVTNFLGGLGGDGVLASFTPGGPVSPFAEVPASTLGLPAVYDARPTEKGEGPVVPQVANPGQDDVIHPAVAELRNWLTVTDAPTLHESATGAGLDGVVGLFIARPDLGGTAGCTGSLLQPGYYVLTAAHCVSAAGTPHATSIDVVFELPGGDVTLTTDSYYIHPQWNGDYLHGYDVALIELPTEAPALADRYDIYRNSDELGQPSVKVGYGATGTGSTGATQAGGIKHDGQNLYDAPADIFDGFFFTPGSVTPGSQLAYDFDNGQVGNDAMDFFFGISELGFGNDEVNSAPGDSGGPTFVNGLIAGVTSYGFGFNGAPDVVPGTNSSFGEMAVDTRVSFVANWVDFWNADPADIGPTVVEIDPPSGTQANLSIDSLHVEFDEPLDPLTATDPANYDLREAGPDGMFDTVDDVVITVSPSFDGDRTVWLGVENFLPLGSYRLTLDGDSSIEDLDGNPLNSRSGPGGGSDHVHTFSVTLPGVHTGDYYTVTLTAGEPVAFGTGTPFDAQPSPWNGLNPALVVRDPAGNVVEYDGGSARDGKNARLTFVAPVDGVYTVQVAHEAGSEPGEYVLQFVNRVGLIDGDLIVVGEGQDERIVVYENNAGQVMVRIYNMQTRVQDIYGGFDVTGKIVIYGQDGRDMISSSLRAPIPLEVHGGPGDDYIAGGTGDDQLFGDDGNDTILGGEGNNLMDGGAGNDRISGRDGIDTIYGGDGDDRLSGGGGNDLLEGGAGNDMLDGGLDDDLLRGGTGDDTLSGCYGDDVLVGDAGDDQLFGRQGNDLLIGGIGADRLDGGYDNDILVNGTTSHDADDAALLAILNEWRSAPDIDSAIAAIGALPKPLDTANVFDDVDKDDLNGSLGDDWFWAETLDLVRDRGANDRQSP